ncbi:MAG: Erythromycin esterase [Modestobacter sp.]|nr:Erythromycin esterase [Modestobacter sp.]
MGEASHGTHEYYAWRATLTRRLIEERGFGFVAVEGDWPDCYRVNRSVKLRAGADEDPRDALDAIERWPTWMWANDDVVGFCRWLQGSTPSGRQSSGPASTAWTSTASGTRCTS